MATTMEKTEMAKSIWRHTDERTIYHEITPFAKDLAAQVRAEWVKTVEEVDAPEYPFPPDICEMSPGWWQDQIDLHPKWIDRILERALQKARQTARCASLRGHCLGCEKPFEATEKRLYVCREYLKPLKDSCPRTYQDLLDSLKCKVPEAERDDDGACYGEGC